MTFPFDSLHGLHKEFGLVGAVLLGFFFGFVLERAGFGRATKLAAQFYGNDMTVFKVMFGAIVTAMLGVVVAAGLGWTDFRLIAESAASTTFLWPMLVGGLLLGVGFIVSGYCPGTSLVAAASGHIDGVVTIIGVGLGSLLFGELYPVLQGFYTSGDLGHQFLFELLGVPPAVLAVGVAVMAAGCFLGAEVLEGVYTRKRFGAVPALVETRPRRLVFTSFAVAGAIGLATLLAPPAAPEAQAAAVFEQIDALHLDAPRLAHRLLDEPWKVWVLDVRERPAYEAERIPGSEHRALDELDTFGLAYSPGVKDLVLVSGEALPALPAAARAYPGRVYVLDGGFEAWQRFALDEPPSLEVGAAPSRCAAVSFQSAVYRKATGSAAPPPPPAAAAGFTPPPKKKGGGCDG